MATVRGVGLIKVTPETMTGKYKLGKYWELQDKIRIATRMMERAIKNPERTLELLNIAGFDKLDDKTTKELAWIHSTEITRMMGFHNDSGYPDISLSVAEDVDW